MTNTAAHSAANSARRLWLSVEALHDVVYFAPSVRQAGMSLGLKGFWMTYFAFRSAPLGPADPAVVVATFAGFHPDMVRKALPDAWSRTSPEVCIEVRARVCAEALRAAGVDPDACGAAARVLHPLASAADPTGRALFAANVHIELSDDPVAALWQVATTLREHRGDGHVAALTAAGISGLEAHVLQVASGRFPADAIRAARGWSEQDWAAAAERLRARALIVGEADGPALTDDGRALLSEIEARTDHSAWLGALSRLGDGGVDEVVSVLEPSVSALWSSGVLPAINPIGIRPPSGD